MRDAFQERLSRHERSLSPFASRSSASQGRQRREAPPPFRGPFQLDRERILGTNAFRRLKHKTQVFIAPQGDHYITRLTHTLEVCQIARTISRALRLNEDLSEAIALAHDLGHTPFGHTGEDALDALYPGGFRHAAQSIRILETLEGDGHGLNLTWETRQGVLAHSKPRGDFLAGDAALDMTLEAQACRLADALAYVSHDLRDALRAGILRKEDLPQGARRLLGPDPSEWLEIFVQSAVEGSWAVSGDGAVPPEERPAVTMGQSVRDALVLVREFMFQRVYTPLALSEESQAASRVVELLYNHLCRHPQEMPSEFSLRQEPVERTVVDYVAGMTDYFAMRAAERLQPGVAAGIGSYLV